jgi:hypothetical protein
VHICSKSNNDGKGRGLLLRIEAWLNVKEGNSALYIRKEDLLSRE